MTAVTGWEVFFPQTLAYKCTPSPLSVWRCLWNSFLSSSSLLCTALVFVPLQQQFGMVRTGIFCHMAQGMLSNAGSSELSLHLGAGRASQILNKHLHESLQVNQESQPSSALFQACKDFFFPSLPWRKFISEYC